jgi:hypothetical protein
MTDNTQRSNSLYLPPTNYGTQSEINFYPQSFDPTSSARPLPVRSLSPEDVQKMKYKIALGLKKNKSSFFLFLFA